MKQQPFTAQVATVLNKFFDGKPLNKKDQFTIRLCDAAPRLLQFTENMCEYFRKNPNGNPEREECETLLKQIKRTR